MLLSVILIAVWPNKEYNSSPGVQVSKDTLNLALSCAIVTVLNNKPIKNGTIFLKNIHFMMKRKYGKCANGQSSHKKATSVEKLLFTIR
jgi:hypothetical protein